MSNADAADDALRSDPRSLTRLLAETIDVEERLRAVKAAAAESGRRLRPHPPAPTRDQMLVASAGAVAALMVYLRWRSRRPARGVPHAGPHGVRRERGLRRLLDRSAGRAGGPG